MRPRLRRLPGMWRCPTGVYGWTPPSTSHRCVRSVGVRPAPETPDLPSMAIGGGASPAPTSGGGGGSGGAAGEREQRGRGVAARVGHERGGGDLLPEELGEAVGPGRVEAEVGAEVD